MSAPLVDIHDALDGYSNQEILDWVSDAGGSSSFLDGVFAGIRDAFLAERAQGASATVQWVIEGPEGAMVYLLEVTAGRCEVSPGLADTPDVTVSVGLPDFLRLVFGNLDGRDAYRAGLLTVTGDGALADTVNGWFQRPAGGAAH